MKTVNISKKHIQFHYVTLQLRNVKAYPKIARSYFKQDSLEHVVLSTKLVLQSIIFLYFQYFSVQILEDKCMALEMWFFLQKFVLKLMFVLKQSEVLINVFGIL